MRQLDFLAIGDITTDAFIRLTDAHVHCKVDTDACELCVRFADKVPYESLTEISAVGNSPNAAVCAARLGLSAGLVSNLGNDANATACLEILKKEKVDTELVTEHKNAKTNYHFVLWYGAERTILVKHEPYSYALPALTPACWLYLSSIGSGTEKYYEEIADYLAKHPETKFAFQPGTFQITLGTEKLRSLYARAEVLVCNKEEALRVLARDDDMRNFLENLRALGPKIVCITDGPKGAYMGDESGTYFMPPYPDPKPPVERTGAGDAFAATFVSYLAFGKTPMEALRFAPINSAYVVQEIGAQRGLLLREALERYLTHAPKEYAPRPL